MEKKQPPKHQRQNTADRKLLNCQLNTKNGINKTKDEDKS